MKRILGAALIAAATMTAIPAVAQTPSENAAKGGALGGAAAGAVGGAIVGGPIGAAVGGVAGAAAGAISGSLTADDRVYARDYVVQRRVAPVTIRERVVVGEPLPPAVALHPIEGNPRLAAYRYGYVNDNYYLVDSNGRVVQVIER